MSLEVDGQAVSASAFPGRQGRLAFAYLAVNHRPVSRDELAEALWSDALPDGWERYLSAVISKLRALLVRVGLGRDVIAGAFGNYELRLPLNTEVDIEAALVYLENAEAALRSGRPDAALATADVAANLARRPFVAGEEGQWIERKRSELRAALVRALEIEIELLRLTGPRLRVHPL